MTEAAWLLLDQARIVGGEPLPDPAAFSKRQLQAMRRAPKASDGSHRSAAPSRRPSP